MMQPNSVSDRIKDTINTFLQKKLTVKHNLRSFSGTTPTKVH